MAVEVHVGRRDDAFAVRRKVFMEEQGYENEYDAIDDDPQCLHVTLTVDGETAGCSRVFPEAVECSLSSDAPKSPVTELDEGVAPESIYLLGRVAVLPQFRHRGFAATIIRESEKAACAAGAKLVKLHAQEHVQPLYAKEGYRPIAPVDYVDEGQPHVWMAKRL